MAKTIKDTDYLVISARVKALETGLLTAERMEQILDAKSGEDAGKLLQEWGYPQLDPRRPEAMDAALSAVREATLADLAEGTPDARYIDLFKVKYDYHNVKALLKAEAVGTAPDRMLMDMGRVSTAELAEAVRSRELDGLPETLAAAVVEAREVLDTTRDPQLSDIVLDRWCYRDMAALAEETGSAFLRGYVAVQVDAVNLRTAVRTLRMGKGADFLLGALLEGGDLAPDAVAKAASSGAAGLRELYGATRFRDAAEAGAEALKGGPLTAFEKLCDDAVGDYLAGAQSVPFGEAPLVSYLAARETEYTNLRILLMGRAAGMHLIIATQRPSADVITGLMKANIPSRIAFAVASSLESRIILDTTGAEKLVGRGDMLYFPLGSGKPTRVQGCLISDQEVASVVDFVKQNSGTAQYDDQVMQEIEQHAAEKDKASKGVGGSNPSESGEEEYDELINSAIEVVLETGQASVSMLQRRLKLGYARAARLVDQMEEKGIVGPFEGSKARQLLITKEQWQEIQYRQGIVSQAPGQPEAAPEPPAASVPQEDAPPFDLDAPLDRDEEDTL